MIVKNLFCVTWSKEIFNDYIHFLNKKNDLPGDENGRSFCGLFVMVFIDFFFKFFQA